MIKLINYDLIKNIWVTHLWPGRNDIEPHSAMLFKEGHDLKNFMFKPTFLGYYFNEMLVGVNSGHRCCDSSYRSRGLFVLPEYRNKGIATKLLSHTIEQGIKEGSKFVWSYPRKESWHSYEKAGFFLASDWNHTEYGYNAFCSTTQEVLI